MLRGDFGNFCREGYVCLVCPKRRNGYAEAIHVVEPCETALAGVRRPTRFVCARRVAVAIDHPGWDINRALVSIQEENLGAVDVEQTAADLAEIDMAAAAIEIEGERYLAQVVATKGL